jgi:hypothetical protein
MVVGRRKSLNTGTYFVYPPLRKENHKHNNRIRKSVFGDLFLTLGQNPQTCLETPFRDRIRNAPVITRAVTHLHEVRVRHLRLPLPAQHQQLCSYKGKETFVKFREGFFNHGLGVDKQDQHTVHRTQTPIQSFFKKFSKILIISLCYGSIGTVSSYDFSKAGAWPGVEIYPSFIAVLRIRDILVRIRIL